MNWDPEVESPATIAIVGAGPIGVEAALYARFLGYSIWLFDQRRVASRLKKWGRWPMAVTVGECTTPLGHAALRAQDEAYQMPPATTVWTGEEFAENYVIPLAKSDLLHDDVHFNCRVVDIARVEHAWNSVSDIQERCNDEFRIVLDSRYRGAWSTRADVILDCTGLARRDGLGPGGGQAIGEDAVRQSIRDQLPSSLAEGLQAVQSGHTVIVGLEHDAIHAVHDWRIVAEQQEAARLSWIIPSYEVLDATAEAAIESLAGYEQLGRVAIYRATGIEQIAYDEQDGWTIQLVQGADSVEIRCSTLIASTRWRSDWSFCRSLRVLQWTPLIETQLSLEASMLRDKALADSEHGGTEPDRSDTILDWPAKRLACLEPNYYVLGSKLQEGVISFDWQNAHRQIRDLFAMLGGRETLDLYATIASP